jgi:hypothetical protein
MIIDYMPGKSLAAIAAVVGLVLMGAGSLAREELLWRYRNLGKALYENPATASLAPGEYDPRKPAPIRASRQRERNGECSRLFPFLRPSSKVDRADLIRRERSRYEDTAARARGAQRLSAEQMRSQAFHAAAETVAFSNRHLG